MATPNDGLLVPCQRPGRLINPLLRRIPLRATLDWVGLGLAVGDAEKNGSEGGNASKAGSSRLLASESPMHPLPDSALHFFRGRNGPNGKRKAAWNEN